MPRLTIDGRQVEVAEGATLLDAARALGLDVPTLCTLPDLPPGASCFVCVMQVEGRERLLPSCATLAEDGMVAASETSEVYAARRAALELLLSDHCGECLAPCQRTCPLHLDVPGLLRDLAAGDTERAAARAGAMPLPEMLGALCHRPCEGGCARREVLGPDDDPLAVRALHRFLADRRTPPGEAPPRSGKRVAIVGAGPAGLSTAHELLRRGHHTVLLDRHQEPGGSLRRGPRAEEVPVEALEREMAALREAGAELRTAAEADPAELRGAFDAVVLATGQPATGEPQEGVFSAARRTGSPLALVVAAGQEAAAAVDAFLSGQEAPTAQKPFSTVLRDKTQRRRLRMAGREPEPQKRAPSVDDPESAHTEAKRCLQCGCASANDCRLRDLAARYGASSRGYGGSTRPFEGRHEGHGVVHEPGKCIACGLCVRIAERAGEPLGITFVGRGFDVRVGAPFDASSALDLQRTARACADACPSGALMVSPERDAGVESAQPGSGDGS